ncbi:hypothetical protein ACSNOK_36285, partial [Streptomyces sp. URMC 126]|uniref:hypothetical protein n=1 Tax=Streptomyces sp. URMC 126 TaxID=3423401 RepID=UPI003F1BA9F9
MLVDGETLGVELDWSPGARRVRAVIGDEPLTVGIARGRVDWRLTTRGATHVARALPRSIADLARHM